MSLSSSFPATRPELLLDFANGKAISSEISFRRESVATYFDKNGVLATAPVHEPRIDYDPVTLQPKGLLIEEARTNLVFPSKSFSVASFTGVNSWVADSGVAPDGTQTAALATITDITGGSNSARTSDQNTNPANTDFTGSCFVKRVSGDGRLRLGVGDNTTQQTAFVIIDLNNMTSISTTKGPGNDPTIVGATVTDVGNGWFRYSITSRFANSYPNAFQMAIAGHQPNGGAINGPGNIGSFLVWGVQLGQGSFPTSYIPTTSGAVTRAAETAFIPSLGRFFSPSQGSALCEMYYTTIATGAAANQWGHMMTFGTESGNAPRIDYYAQIQTTAANSNGMGNGVFKITNSAGVSQSDVAGQGGIVRDGLYKYAAGFSGTEMATYKNGSFFYSYPSVDLSGNSEFTRLTIGGLSSATGVSNHLNGHIRKIAYWPRRLTNAQLAALTR